MPTRIPPDSALAAPGMPTYRQIDHWARSGALDEDAA